MRHQTHLAMGLYSFAWLVYRTSILLPMIQKSSGAQSAVEFGS